ncbi:cation:dicarboxylate symporter family transporter [Cetobacterium sp.]|uniref:cation:dicarboxylate symporter family transporter n=1 Tax=Cetobacterium sp. TaxID=2071632 RepID=UPI003F336C83
MIFKLIFGVIIGLIIGLFANESLIGVVQTIKFILGQIISFTVPLIILGFIAPAITKMKSNASKMLVTMLMLFCAKKSNTLDEDVANFAIPLGATVHLCGSVLTEVFFVMTVSQVLYGTLPTMGTMVLFIVLLGIFAIGALALIFNGLFKKNKN